MKTAQKQYTKSGGWKIIKASANIQAQLVLCFGDRFLLNQEELTNEILEQYKDCQLIFCSTSGEISDVDVEYNSIIVTEIEFASTSFHIYSTRIEEHKSSAEAGNYLARQIDTKNLNNVLIVSDGQKVNGDELIKGLKKNIPVEIPITGGLAGDGDRFETTLVGYNNHPESGVILAIAFHGEHLQIGHGSQGGWDSFGPERQVTRSEGNKLFELDGKSALELYKMYLGNKANKLPGSALMFPLSVQENKGEDTVVRTILSIDHKEGAMIFAGDIPQGSKVRLMKYNFDRLIDGAMHAAEHSTQMLSRKVPDLAILISCVGRRLVLNDRVGEELDEVREIFGDHTLMTGFYSYGEICPASAQTEALLHNQTMTITSFYEA